MKLKKLSVEGVTRFESPVEIDFESLPEGLIAVAGPNGAGKTTLLELSGPGTLYRELPTRSPGGSLSNWRGPKGGRSRLVFELDGSEYVSEVLIDSRGSMTAFLSKDGDQVVSGKVRDYDGKISQIVGPKDAFLVSVFGSQGGRGRFSSLKVSERKSIFRYYLGLDRVESLHKKASEMVSSLSKCAGQIEGLEATLEATQESLSGAVSDYEEAFDNIERTSIQIESLKSELESASEALALVDIVELYDKAIEEVVDRIERREAAESEFQQSPRAEGPRPEIEALREIVQDVQLKSVERRSASREAFKLYSDAMKERDDLRRRSALLCEVPCEGEGEFASCPLISDAKQAKKRLEELSPALPELRAQASKLEAEAEELSEELERCRELERAEAKKFEEWSSVQDKHEAASEHLSRCVTAELEARQRALSFRSKLPKERPSEEQIREDVQRLKDELTSCERLHDEAVRKNAEKSAEAKFLHAESERLSEEIEQRRQSIEEAGALTLLRDALGPNGIQAFEIDAAGPRVSELANDLLSSCYGDRFSVSVTTLKEKKGGGMKEDFAIQVVDSERGPDRDISGLSGGEQVIVDEALRTALSLFAAERNALPIETLWRDETVGALDGENAARYVQMLHRARKLGRFHRIVYVTHDEKAIEGADGVIRISSRGEVTT